MVAHIRVLETELMNAEDMFLSEQRQNDRIRAELLDLLAAARSSREDRYAGATRAQTHPRARPAEAAE
jgi:hypothetical protein